MERELRKQQNQLVDAGIGVILFAVWSIVKMNLYVGLNATAMEELRQAAVEFGLNEKGFLTFLIIIFMGILLWQLSIRLYIGLSASAEGKGRKKSWTYLILAAVLVVTDIQTNWQALGVERVLAGEKMSVSLLTCICMEAVSVYVLMDLLISGIRVKRMRRKMKE